MPIPDLPLFRHRDTVVTPADQNQFVTQFENTMDTLSNGVIPAMNTSISDMNTQYNNIYNNLPFAPDSGYSQAYIDANIYKKTEIDEITIINNFIDKPTPDDTDNLVLQEVGGDLKKVSYKNLFDKVSITGNATFNGTTQTIDLTGIGNITLAIGDVIEVTGTTSNNKLFTVESIPNANQIIVNYEHRGASTPIPSKRLINETVNCTIKLYNRAKNAPLGQGQGWCIPASGRVMNVSYINNSNRVVSVACTARALGESAQITLFVDDLKGGQVSPSGTGANIIGQIYMDISSDSAYRTSTSSSVDMFQMLEKR